MKKRLFSKKLFLVCLFLLAGRWLVSAAEGTASENALPPVDTTDNNINIPADAWPRQFKLADGTAYILYQPQLQSWDGFSLKAIAAVSVLPEGAKSPSYGVIELKALTLTDRDKRTVAFESVSITKTMFPTGGDSAAKWEEQLKQHLPAEVPGIALDRLEAALDADQAKKNTVDALNNAPPAIVFTEKPTLLVLVDGDPQWQKINDTALERVVNTHALIVRDGKRVFLHLWDGYLESGGLEGPWTVASKLPEQMESVEKQLVAAKAVDLLAGQANPDTKQMPSLKTTPVPDLYLAFKPTELIVTEGAPTWTPVFGTSLIYICNTPSQVFKDITDQKTYLLLSGRWFESESFAGPWVYIPGSKLPSDFAKIPDDSPKENVKAAIPGTIQAKEAAIANSIPQTMRIERSETKIEPAPSYGNGAPQLAPIPGTSLSYVVNSVIPVIKVSDTAWYACQNAVWFSASSANGPWIVATEVPSVIYTIPATCPVYYVTYVRVYRYDEHYVYVGYTPGYYGAIIGADGTVVYGTGYLYPAYVGETVYVSYPVTYGYACNPYWTPWAGWFCGFAVGWAWADWYYWSYCPPAPYWGPYWPYCYGWGYNPYGGITAWGPYGWAGTSGIIYRDNGAWHSASRAAGGFDSWTGNRWGTEYGHAYNSVTGTRVAGQRGAVENVYTGNYAYGARGAAHNDNSGVSAWGGHGTAGNENTGREISGGHATVYNPNTGNVSHIAGAHGNEGNAVLDVNGNVYAGHDGHVYQRNDDGSWKQLSRPSGDNQFIGGQTRDTNLEKQGEGSRFGGDAASRNENFNRDDFEREHQNRQFGENRTQGFRMSHPSFQGFHGGGGFHGFHR